MNFDDLLSVNLDNKEALAAEFSRAVNKLKHGGDVKPCELFDVKRVINRFGKVIYLVPRKITSLFERMSKEHPDELLGYSVLVGDVRISCFGVPCSKLAKALTK